MNVQTTITATVDGHTLKQFSNLIEKRIKLLKETPAKALGACMINVVKALRARTKIAKVTKIYPDIEIKKYNNVYVGFKTIGKGQGAIKVPQLRLKGSNQQYILPEGYRFVILDKSVKASLLHVYMWKGKTGKTVLVASTSKGEVTKWIKEKEKERIKRYRGLAKCALGKVAHKIASSINFKNNVEAVANSVAERNTHVIKQEKKSGSRADASITLKDELKYATDALKGGEGDVERAIMSATNKIASVINMRMKNVFEWSNIETPFPNI